MERREYFEESFEPCEMDNFKSNCENEDVPHHDHNPGSSFLQEVPEHIHFAVSHRTEARWYLSSFSP